MSTPIHIFELNLSWADRIARAVHRKIPPSFELDDLQQEARIKLWDCCQKFDAASGVPFQAFAYLRVRGAVLMSIRRRAWTAANADELFDTHIDPRSDIEARIEAEDRARDRRRQAEYNLAAFEAFASEEVGLLRMMYLDGHEEFELVELLGISAKQFGRTAKKAVQVIRRRLETDTDKPAVRVIRGRGRREREEPRHAALVA